MTTSTKPQIWRAEIYEWRTDPPLLGQEPMECPYVVAIHDAPTETEAQQAAECDIAAMLEYQPDMKLTANVRRNHRAELSRDEDAEEDGKRLRAGFGIHIQILEKHLAQLDGAEGGS